MESVAYVQTASSVRPLAKRNNLLFVGGCFSLAFAIFQISAIWWPSNLVRYFGGPVALQATRPGVYAATCVVIAAMVAGCGLYALSGAGRSSRLPLLRTVVVIATVVYLLRGLQIIADLIGIYKYPDRGFGRFVVFSAISLCVGLIHLGGVIRLFKSE